jgi:phosphoribosylaminoimidazolecarboxamide formyltransferase/IMP cyclohydrolase
MKHNNPCGVAYGKTISEAYDRANMADRIAAFGGCLVVNRPMDKATAEMVSNNYLEVVGAPDFEEGTIEILAKRKNLRIVRIGRINDLEKYRSSRFVDFKCLIDGGIIVQQSPINKIRSKADFLPAKATYKGKEYAIERQPTDKDYDDMLFGWNVEQGITSNSVIYVKDGVTVGIGTGEQDRVGVAEIAVDELVQRCLLVGVLTVPQPFFYQFSRLLVRYLPRALSVHEGLTAETDRHVIREVVIHNRLVHLLQLCHGCLLCESSGARCALLSRGR